jgi:DNA processing protein
MEARYLYSALSRLGSVPTSVRASLLGHRNLLERLREGEPPRGLPPSLCKAFARLDWEAAEAADRALEARGDRILCWEDPNYPERLRHLPDPPPALYLRGDLAPLDLPVVAVVGSRLSTVYGQNVARSLAEDLARSGCTVVSGLARGIDAAAHEGSLTVPGRAAAVLGTGLDLCYPPENEPLLGAILEARGLVLTEFPPGTPPLPRNFPQRNRIIAGLAFGVLVVEATERSGSLVTARFALETGREVFAVPHNLTSRTGIGPNLLIQKGAKLVLQVSDILEELPEEARNLLKRETSSGRDYSLGPELSPEAREVLALLRPDSPSTVDELCAASGLSPGDLLPRLLELQMGGYCVELPGMRYAAKRTPTERTGWPTPC